jgi:hypothetical protein
MSWIEEKKRYVKKVAAHRGRDSANLLKWLCHRVRIVHLGSRINSAHLQLCGEVSQ